MIRNYLKIAWRNLIKNKITGFINIAGLAIGMAVALMIGFWLQDELSFNKNFDNYDQLTQVYINQTFNDNTRTSRAIALPVRTTLEADFGSDFKALSLSSWNFEHILGKGDRSFLRNGLFVEPSFIDMFSVEMLHGDKENALKDVNTILLSESVAQALFDAADPIGKTVRFDAVSDMEVVGVFRDFPKNSEMYETRILMPWKYFENQFDWVSNSMENWGNHSFQLYAQLNQESNLATVNQKIKDIEKEHNPRAKPEHQLFPMSKWHLYSEFKNGINVGGRIQYLWLFGIIGIFVLMLACINFMNLSTARSEKRAKEVGIRKTIGSVRSQLIGQFLSESILVSFLALMAALIIVQLSLNWFNELADKAMIIPWSNPSLWVLLLSFTAFTGILAGSYPAFYLSSFKPLKVLKGTFQSGKWATLPRKILVTLQFTVSVALIIGTLVVFQQIQHAKNRPIGYDRSNVIQFMSNMELEDKFEVLRNDLMQSGVVEQAAYSSAPITNVWSNQSDFNWDGKDPEQMVSFAFSATSHEYGKAIGWEVLEGRDFSRAFSSDTAAIILNESAAQFIGIKKLVGKTVEYDESPYQVIGIIKDMIMESPYNPIKPTAFVLDPTWVNVHTVRLKSGIPVREALTSIQTVFKKHSPSSPFEYEFIDDEYNAKFESEERIGTLAKVFAFLAIFISCLGLFGLSAYVAERRTKEIGIRKVLGATVANLWAMQSKGFIWLVLIACLIATPVAWYFLDSWLADFEYRIELSWTVFIISTLISMVITLLTVSFQSVKAALSSPSECLRSE